MPCSGRGKSCAHEGVEPIGLAAGRSFGVFQPDQPPALEAVCVGRASCGFRRHYVRVVLSQTTDEESVQLGVLVVVELSLQDVA